MAMTSIEAFVHSQARPLPDISPEGAPFWAGLQEGELRIQHCTSCDKPRHPPRPACRQCGSVDSEWRAVDTRGHVYSFTAVHRAPSDAFRELVPYLFAVVELSSAPVRLVGNILGTPPDRVAVGMPVNLVIDKISEQLSLYHFETLVGHEVHAD